MQTGDTSTDNLYAFLKAEGMDYRETTLEIADMITRYLRDGSGESLPRALELCKSLQRILDLA
jgi:hypothetical protein